MENKTFNKIISSLDNIIEECNSTCVHSKEELENLTINEVNLKIAKAKELQGKVDKLAQADLYHIIGMGDLTDEQTLLLCKKVKYACMFRSYIKPLASSSITLVKIPDNEMHEYDCKITSLKLKNKA